MSNNKINFTKSAIEALPLPPKGKRAHYYDTKIRGLGLSVTGTGTKSFLVYRWVSGKPERIQLGRFPDLTIEGARRKTAEINALIVNGENPNDKRREDRAEITLDGLFTEYLERYAKIHKRSWEADKDQFERYLSGWRKRKLSQISRQDLQKLHHEVGGKNGHYTANRLLALLSVLFNKAREFGLWENANPATGIKKFPEHSRDRFLQADELPRFFTALAQEPNEMMRSYFLLALLTGARRSNVLAMRWEEIDFVRQEWRIPDTKNKTPQIVALTEEAVMILKQRQEAVSKLLDSDKSIKKNIQYVFPSFGRTGHLMEPKKAWERILEKAKLTQLRIHDLRRTLGSWQARSGASLAIIGKSLNHKTQQATAIYARLDLDPVRASLEKATNAMLVAGGLKDRMVNDEKTS